MLSTTGSFFPKIQVQPPKIKGTNGNSPYHTARRGSINSIEEKATNLQRCLSFHLVRIWTWPTRLRHLHLWRLMVVLMGLSFWLITLGSLQGSYLHSRLVIGGNWLGSSRLWIKSKSSGLRWMMTIGNNQD